MSYIRSNFQMPSKANTRKFSDDEVPTMSIERFDKLSLAEQIHIYHAFPNEYARLTGRPYEQTATDTAPTPQETEQERFAREFEERVDRAFQTVLGHKAGEID